MTRAWAMASPAADSRLRLRLGQLDVLARLEQFGLCLLQRLAGQLEREQLVAGPDRVAGDVEDLADDSDRRRDDLAIADAGAIHDHAWDRNRFPEGRRPCSGLAVSPRFFWA